MGNEWKGLEMLIPRKIKLDKYGFLTEIEYLGPLTSAVIVSPDGIRARGYSRLNYGDIYDEGFGEYLAVTRAMYRLLRKLEKKAIKEGA